MISEQEIKRRIKQNGKFINKVKSKLNREVDPTTRGLYEKSIQVAVIQRDILKWVLNGKNSATEEATS